MFLKGFALLYNSYVLSKTTKLVLFLIFSRIIILIIPWLTITLLFPEIKSLNFLDFTLNAWNRWDGLHYTYLSQHWYTNIGDEANFIVFFPLYPLLVKVFSILTIKTVFLEIILSSTFFVIGSYYFYKLVQIDYSEKIATWAVIALAIFPTSYFFNAPYTESLFLLLFSTSFYCARRENWIATGLITGLTCITRPFGILILAAILVEWFYTKTRSWKNLPIIVLPSVVAVIYYLFLNQNIYGDPLMFQKILANHWQKHLISPISGIMDSWRIARSGGLTNFVLMVGWAEAVTATVSWVLVPFSFKYLRESWAVFYTLGVLAFSSTSFILSTPRYLLSIPPLFVLIALAQENYLFKIVWSFVSIALLFSLAILFARGQWAF